MLDLSVLERLQYFASEGEGGILEIGPYIGGSTLALASGHRGRKRHAVIEAGGSHDHPTLPSSDIVADWKTNVDAFGMRDAVLLCEGWSYTRSVQQRAALHVHPIGLMFVDADGFVASQIQAFASYMRPDCTLAIDDYFAPGAEEKSALIKPFIDRHVAEGRLVELCRESSTWFGRVAGSEALGHFQKMMVAKPNGGHAFLSPSRFAPVADNVENFTQSPLRIFENGEPLGPPHSAHHDIRDFGEGRYSHWSADGQAWLYWSTSDNSDPTRNDRTYEADFGRGRIPLWRI